MASSAEAANESRSFDSLVECVGFERDTLTPDQRDKIEAFIASHPPGALLGVKLYSNLDTTSDDDLPTGMMAIFSPDATVDPTVIGDRMFQTVAVSKMFPREPVTDAYFQDKLEDIKGSVDQFPANPPSGRIRNHKSKELEPWAPELGGPGSFVGVYSKLRENMRDKDYFVVGRGTVPLYVRDLRKSVAANPPTYRELVYGDDWRRGLRYGDHLARRNLFRSMANVAEACGVKIALVDDGSAKLPTPNCAPPELAVPEWEQATHSIQPIMFDQNTPAVAVAYGVVPAKECLLSPDQNFFVVGNAYDGINLFRLSQHSRIEAAGAIPADTGRSVPPDQISQDPAHYRNRLCGVVWDGQEQIGSSIHPDLHPEAFKTVGNEFREAMKYSGWNAEDHIERLIPTAVKIYNDAIDRKHA